MIIAICIPLILYYYCLLMAFDKSKIIPLFIFAVLTLANQD